MPQDATTLEEHSIISDDSSTTELSMPEELASEKSESEENAEAGSLDGTSQAEPEIAPAEASGKPLATDMRSWDSGFLVDPEVAEFGATSEGDLDEEFGEDADEDSDEDSDIGDDESWELDEEFDLGYQAEDDEYLFSDDEEFDFEEDDSFDENEVYADTLFEDDLYSDSLFEEDDLFGEDLSLDEDFDFDEGDGDDLEFDNELDADDGPRLSKPEIREALPPELKQVYDQQIRGVEKLHRQVSEGREAMDGIESVLLGVGQGDSEAVKALDRLLGLAGGSLSDLLGSPVLGGGLDSRLNELETRLQRSEHEATRQQWCSEVGTRIAKTIFEAKGIRIPASALFDAQSRCPRNASLDQIIDAVGETNFQVYKKALEGQKKRRPAPPSARLGNSKTGMGTGNLTDALSDPVAWKKMYESTMSSR